MLKGKREEKEEKEDARGLTKQALIQGTDSINWRYSLC